MKILITGATGQVGRSTLALNGLNGHEIFGLSRTKFDLTRPEGFDKIVDEIEPDVIINAAAYTAVDKAEDNPELANQINAVTPGVMAAIAAKSDIRFIQISTDYVFDGFVEEPYREKDPTNPINIYGKTKLLGENLVKEGHPNALILRTAWIFSNHTRNFYSTIASLSIEREILNVVDDQRSGPTFADDLAETLIRLVENYQLLNTERNLHYSGFPYCSWFEFASQIVSELSQIHPNKKFATINAISSQDFPQAATRPKHTELSCDAIKGIFKIPPCDWRNALRLISSSYSGAENE